MAKMARPKGVEPLTKSLEGSCSILLSYGRVKWCDLVVVLAFGEVEQAEARGELRGLEREGHER